MSVDILPNLRVFKLCISGNEEGVADLLISKLFSVLVGIENLPVGLETFVYEDSTPMMAVAGPLNYLKLFIARLLSE